MKLYGKGVSEMFNEPTCSAQPLAPLEDTSFEKRLTRERERLQKKVDHIDALLEALNASPQTKAVVELITQLGPI